MVVLHRPSDKISHLRDAVPCGVKMPVRVAREAEALAATILTELHEAGMITSAIFTGREILSRLPQDR